MKSAKGTSFYPELNFASGTLHKIKYMSYSFTDLTGSAKEIIQQVLDSDKSQLLVPPKLADQNLDISNPPTDDKYIGLFSSGSTGTPKCIWNTEERLLLNGRLTAKAFGVSSSDKLLMMAAPWHVAGFSWALMAEQLGCEYYFLSTKKGEEDRWLKAVQKYKPDFLMTVPAVLRALFGHTWFVPNVVYGGYPIRNEDYASLAKHCSTMIQGYGQTEAGGLISCYHRSASKISKPDEHLCHGKVIDGGKLTCKGTIHHPKPILLYSPTAFTNETYDTCDLGYMDEYGNIHITPAEERDNSTTQKGMDTSKPN